MTEEKGNTVQLMNLQHLSVRNILIKVRLAIDTLWNRFPDCDYANLHITIEIHPDTEDEVEDE